MIVSFPSYFNDGKIGKCAKFALCGGQESTRINKSTKKFYKSHSLTQHCPFYMKIIENTNEHHAKAASFDPNELNKANANINQLKSQN
jgi:hypothetical protein